MSSCMLICDRAICRNDVLFSRIIMETDFMTEDTILCHFHLLTFIFIRGASRYSHGKSSPDISVPPYFRPPWTRHQNRRPRFRPRFTVETDGDAPPRRREELQKSFRELGEGVAHESLCQFFHCMYIIASNPPFAKQMLDGVIPDSIETDRCCRRSQKAD
jgi:hypothetical protein